MCSAVNDREWFEWKWEMEMMKNGMKEVYYVNIKRFRLFVCALRKCLYAEISMVENVTLNFSKQNVLPLFLPRSTSLWKIQLFSRLNYPTRYLKFNPNSLKLQLKFHYSIQSLLRIQVFALINWQWDLKPFIHICPPLISPSCLIERIRCSIFHDKSALCYVRKFLVQNTCRS